MFAKLASESSLRATATTDGHDENDALWANFVATRNEDLRLQLIDIYLPFARMLAGKLYGRRHGLDAPFEDYLHNAVVALIQSVDLYEPSQAANFKTYAQYRIEGAILNEIPRLSEQHAQVALVTRLRKERMSSLQDSSPVVELRPKKHQQALFEQMLEIAVGLSIGFMLEDYGMYRGAEKVTECDGYSTHATNEMRALMQDLVDLLPNREKTVIKQHYFFGMGIEEIGNHMQLSKGRISQIHKHGLKLLKEMADAVGLNLSF